MRERSRQNNLKWLVDVFFQKILVEPYRHPFGCLEEKRSWEAMIMQDLKAHGFDALVVPKEHLEKSNTKFCIVCHPGDTKGIRKSNLRTVKLGYFSYMYGETPEWFLDEVNCIDSSTVSRTCHYNHRYNNILSPKTDGERMMRLIFDDPRPKWAQPKEVIPVYYGIDMAAPGTHDFTVVHKPRA